MAASLSRLSSRILAALAALAMVLSMVALAPPALADEPDVIRVAGVNRFDTAARVAAATYATGASDVIVAAGYDFPDALAASGVGGLVDAPILLVDDAGGEATSFTLAALAALDPDTVHIAGGTAAVSAAIATEIGAAGDWDVERFAGADRFATAALMAEAFAPADVAGGTAIVATGFVAADSLSAGPLAHGGPHPILLTRSEALPAVTAAALEDLEVDTVLVLGGASAVSAAVLDAIEDLDGISTVTRVAGANRFATAVDIAGVAPFSGGERVILATGFGSGDVPADALAGGPHGGVFGAELLPINDVRDELPAEIAAYLTANAAGIDEIVVLGGTQAVSASVATAAAAAATPEAPEELRVVDVDTAADLVWASDGTAVTELGYDAGDDAFARDGAAVSVGLFEATIGVPDLLEVSDEADGSQTWNVIQVDTGDITAGTLGRLGWTRSIIEPVSGVTLRNIQPLVDDAGAVFTVDGTTRSKAAFDANASIGDGIVVDESAGGEIAIDLVNGTADGVVAQAAAPAIVLDPNPDDDAELPQFPLLGTFPGDTPDPDATYLVDDGEVAQADFAADLSLGDALSASFADDAWRFDLSNAVPPELSGYVLAFGAADVTFSRGPGLTQTVLFSAPDDLLYDGTLRQPADMAGLLSLGDVVAYQPGDAATATDEVLAVEDADLTGEITAIAPLPQTLGLTLPDGFELSLDYTIDPQGYTTAGTQRYFLDGAEEALADWEVAVAVALTNGDEVTLEVIAVTLANEWRVDIAD